MPSDQPQADYREATHADLPTTLALRNQIFPPLTVGQFCSVPDLTMVTAMHEGEAIGALPLAIREFQLGPGETCRAAFLHAVGTHEGWRGRGVGKHMIACAKEFLKGRVDALLVYRSGGERTDGYAFYQKTGFHELMFATDTRLHRGTPSVPQGLIREIGVEAIIDREESLLQVFHALYGAYGGYWARQPGFYRQALRTSYFCARPHEFTLLLVVEEGAPVAYAMVGRPCFSKDAHRNMIFEMATLPGREDRAAALLEAVDHHAPADAEIHFPTSTSSPLWSHIRPFLTKEEIRTPVLLGCLLEPEAWAQRVWKKQPALAGLEVATWAPSGDLTLQAGEAERARKITIGLKDEALVRLLLRRLDLAAAREIEAVTFHGAEPSESISLKAAMPAHPWVYHGLDYI